MSLSDTAEALKTFRKKIYLTSAKKQLEIWCISPSIIRLRYSPDFFARDFSYAIRPGLESVMQEARLDDQHQEYYSIQTPKLECRINKESLNVTFLTPDGIIINEDLDGYVAEPNISFGGYNVHCGKRIQPGEYFSGLGDKASHLNLRGKAFSLWGQDTFGYAVEQDPLYRNIPFYYGLHHDAAYGIFFDNSFKTHFDFGNKEVNQMRFKAEGGELCYYFMYGPELVEVAEHYAFITGAAELPPLWALGYQQSRWSYTPADRVREIAAILRAKKIPCDVIHLDIEYMEEFKVFTWDENTFPNAGQLLQELREQGFRIVTILDPGISINKNYTPYNDGMRNEVFCKRQDGDLFRGKVWPNDPCYFPDFTNPSVRDWWSNLVSEFVKAGVSGCWNDMNEPAVFEIGTMPDDVRHDYDGMDVSHRKGHNVYGMQMAHATCDGMKRAHPHQRPFNLTRSGFAGIQRYAAIWTGDNVTSWEHVWLAAVQCQRLSISGVSFCGADLGGFLHAGDAEISLRFFQLGIFHPLMRCHFSKEHGEKEPWAFGSKYELLIRSAIELRYRLLPYLYTALWQHSHKGTPVIRPLAFYDQRDEECRIRTEEFLCGDHLFTAPVKEAGMEKRIVYLPKGTWFDFFTGSKFEGRAETESDTTGDRFPLYIRAGAIIPMQAVKQHVNEFSDEPLTLRVYYSEKRVVSFLYEDAGDGYEYLQGQCSLKRFTVFGNRRQCRIVQYKQWEFSTSYSRYQLVITGLPFKATEVRVDEITIRLKSKSKKIELTIDSNFKKIVVK